MTKLDELRRQFKAGRLSRREFTNRLVTLGLSLSAANALLVAPAKAQETPKKGGRLRVGSLQASPAETLDTHAALSSLDAMRGMQIYSPLVQTTPTLEVVGELAESWEANKAADEFVFKLRKGVEFHDGRDFGAKDVVYSVRRMQDPKTGSPARSFLADIEEVVAEDTHTVRMKLSQPNVGLPSLFAEYHMKMYADGWTDFTNPIGTGPFKVKTFKPGIRSVTERNPNYFKSGLPHLDEIELFSIPDTTARTSAFLAGEIHLMEDIDPTTIELIDQSPGVEVVSVPTALYIPFSMNVEVPPYNDPDVRLALKLIVDREKYVQIVYKGHGQIGNDHPIAPNYPEHCADLPLQEYDPEKARSLLKKAGYENHTFELNGSEGLQGGMNTALTYSEMAKAAGINIKVIRNPADGFWDTVWMQKPFFGSAWNMRPSADVILTTVFKSDAPWNECLWKRPEFDTLLLEARGTFDHAKRQEMFCEMQRMIKVDGGSVIPAHGNLLDARSSKVKGLIPHPMGSLGYYRFGETCWLES